MNRDQIVEYQRREYEFRATEIGALFCRYENAHATAWVNDTEGRLKTAEQDFARVRELREELIAALRPLLGLAGQP